MAFNKLSILFERDGFSFCTIKDNTLTHQENITFDITENNLQYFLDNAFSTNLYLQQEYDAVYVSYLSEDFNIVPNSYFEKVEQTRSWLEFNNKINDATCIEEAELTNTSAQFIYTIPYELLEFVNNTFSIKKVNSASALFLNSLSIKSTEPQVFINAHAKSLEIAVFNNGEFIFYNIFKTQTKEDVLYYTLTVFKELNFSTNEVKLYFFGLFNNNENLKMMMNFVRHVIPGTSDVTALRYYTETINHTL